MIDDVVYIIANGKEMEDLEQQSVIQEYDKHLKDKFTSSLKKLKELLLQFNPFLILQGLLYEKYINNIDLNTQPVQKILFPEIIQLTPTQTEIMLAIESELLSVGFEISNLGSGSFSITGVPEGSEGLNYQDLLLKFIDIATETGTTDTTLFKKKMVQTLASSAAIPYGQALTAEEMEYLTQELFKLSEANYTPDGKPTLSCLTNEELEKRFK